MSQAGDRDAWRKRVKQVAASSTRTWQRFKQDIAGRLRKNRASKARFHIRRQALARRHVKVAKKAKKMSDARCREAFYKKFEAKYEAHVAKVNFLKPKRRTTPAQKCKPNHALYMHKTIPITITWADAKQQVFSSDSSSAITDNSDSDMTKNGKSDGLWIAAGCESHVHTNSSSDSELWAEAVDPAEYEDCDETPTPDNNPPITSCVAEDGDTTILSPTTKFAPAHSKQQPARLTPNNINDNILTNNTINNNTNNINTSNKTNSHITNKNTNNNPTNKTYNSINPPTNNINTNTNITTDTDNDDDSIIIFNPPEILGHHQSSNKQTADPNATILE